LQTHLGNILVASGVDLKTNFYCDMRMLKLHNTYFLFDCLHIFFSFNCVYFFACFLLCDFCLAAMWQNKIYQKVWSIERTTEKNNQVAICCMFIVTFSQGCNHVFKVGGLISWSRILLPFYRKN